MSLGKGEQAEENLRCYFLQIGYYVLQDVTMQYSGFDVTDIDLFLYARPSALSRCRINVDAKNKKTPQAIERIFWSKGIQTTLGFDDCIVATTDKRKEVRQFGLKHGVSVLDGNFLSTLSKLSPTSMGRLSEHQFLESIQGTAKQEQLAKWRLRISHCKSRIIGGTPFNGANFILEHLVYFINQAIVDESRRKAAVRATYFCLSGFLILVDYALKTLVLSSSAERRESLLDGFKFGDATESSIPKIMGSAKALLQQYIPRGDVIGAQLEGEIEKALSSLRVDILADYFSRPEVSKLLFDGACKFESRAYQLDLMAPSSLPSEEQAIIAVLCDFFEIERALFLDI